MRRVSRRKFLKVLPGLAAVVGLAPWGGEKEEREQGSGGAEEQRSRGAREQGGIDYDRLAEAMWDAPLKVEAAGCAGDCVRAYEGLVADVRWVAD